MEDYYCSIILPLKKLSPPTNFIITQPQCSKLLSLGFSFLSKNEVQNFLDTPPILS